jgi:hypothetical protein
MNTFITVGNSSDISRIEDKPPLSIKKYKKLYKLNREFFDEYVEYKHNSLGYRTYENIPKKYGLAVGCSHTYGVGLKENERWSTLVQESTGVDIINLGAGGTGINFILLNLLRLFTSNIKLPEFIIMQCPNTGRLTLPRPGSTRNIYPGLKAFSPLYRDTSVEYHSIECYKLIHKLCKKEKIKIIDFCFWNSVGSSKKIDVIDYARDLDHPGIKTQQLVKEYVMSKL